jgi:outer membrane protein OmpA-like peptidoglycan-associated protein
LEADVNSLSKAEDLDPKLAFTGCVKGKMVRVTDKIIPLVKLIVELRNNTNQVVQTRETDSQGNFEFMAINRNANFSIELPAYTSNDKNEKIYLANANGELVKQFKLDANNKFVFKILPAEICQLESMNDGDVELTFSKQKNLSKNEIVVQDFVYYSFNSFQISPESKSILDKIAKIVNENSVYRLEIISHTDSRGEQTENQKLSEKRSEAVLAYLVAKKIDPTRLKPYGMGESKPLNACGDGNACIEDEYKMNRRTEFKFYK